METLNIETWDRTWYENTKYLANNGGRESDNLPEDVPSDADVEERPPWSQYEQHEA